MSEHKVTINWVREHDDFSYMNYDRTHLWRFEGGTIVKASAAESFYGKSAFVNPEEALAAALSSCHMLTFLAIASKKNFMVDAYQDHAVALLEKNTHGKLAVTKTFLRPMIAFSGANIPTHEQIMDMHHLSLQECFIANSVLTEVILEPIL